MSDALRVAIRKFGPFESAIAKQYADFQAATGCPLRLEPVALDLNPLFETLFTRGGLKDGTWDIAFIVTDWIAEAVAEGALLDLAPRMRAQPVPDYPAGWAPSLTRFQSVRRCRLRPALPRRPGVPGLPERPLRRPGGAGRLCQATRPAADGPAHLGRVRDGGPLLHPSGSRAVGHHLRRLP